MIRIGITMGDPGGVGPEVLLKALADPGACEGIRPVIFGDRYILKELAKRFELPQDVNFYSGKLPELPTYSPGRYTEAGGRASLTYLESAARCLEEGEVDALVTGPIHKRALRELSLPTPGQTEWLARRFQAKRAVMLLAGPRLKVVLATTHIPLHEVSGVLSQRELVQTIEVANHELTRFFFPLGPRIAVAALNPHGEVNGEPGREEREIISPAVDELRGKQVDVVGPVAGDVVFAQAVAGRYDVVVALYHDQGLAPLKLLHFSDAVNVTLGIGVIRTSPDHGVAYDIAGTGTADCNSTKAAIRLAASMVQRGLA